MERNPLFPRGLGGGTASPIEGEILLDVRVEAEVDRAGAGGRFQELPFRVVWGQGDAEGDFDAGDFSGGFRAHDFSDIEGCACDVDFVAAGDDAHDGHHASTEGGGSQVGGRKRFAFAFVVHGGIGHESFARRAVGRFAAQVAEISNCYFNHSGAERKASMVFLQIRKWGDLQKRFFRESTFLRRWQMSDCEKRAEKCNGLQKRLSVAD